MKFYKKDDLFELDNRGHEDMPYEEFGHIYYPKVDLIINDTNYYKGDTTIQLQQYIEDGKLYVGESKGLGEIEIIGTTDFYKF